MLKVIHFIWAGGKNPLPGKNMEIIGQWENYNPQLKIWLWVDFMTTPKKVVRDYLAIYKTYYSKTYNRRSCIETKDITLEGISDKYVRYEIDRLIPNYGASSDRLRYRILFEYGGAYFDSDVPPGAISLNQHGLFDQHQQDLLLLDTNSQNQGVFGNDAFICTRRHPIIKTLLEVTQYNYHHLGEGGEQPPQYFSEEVDIRSSATIRYTGPIAVAEAFHQHGLLTQSSSSNASNSHPVLLRDGQLLPHVIPEKYHMNPKMTGKTKRNDQSWLVAPIRKCTTLEEAINLTLQSIKFELEEQSLMRLDTHVSNIARSLGLSTTKAGQPTRIDWM